MNKSWLTLMGIGMIVLVVAVGWELYQNVSGNRSNISVTVVDFQRNTLFSPVVEKHLSNDPNFLQFDQQSQEGTGQNGLLQSSGLDNQNAVNQQQTNTTTP